jgi:cytochrome c-type biogenesis protein CcmH
MSAALLLALLAQTPEPMVETTHDQAMQIGQKLRCPVCQGQPIAESPSQMAQDMMGKVREMCAEGKSEDEITQYFVQRYGEWVKLEPTAEGMNLTLWFLPTIALVIGVVVAVAFARRSRGEQATEKAAKKESSGDPYLDAIREEVER